MWQDLPQPFLQSWQVDVRFPAQLDLEDRLLWAIGPEVNGVDWVARRLRSDIPQRQFDSVRSRLLPNDAKRLDRHLLGPLNPGARRCPQS